MCAGCGSARRIRIGVACSLAADEHLLINRVIVLGHARRGPEGTPPRLLAAKPAFAGSFVARAGGLRHPSPRLQPPGSCHRSNCSRFNSETSSAAATSGEAGRPEGTRPAESVRRVSLGRGFRHTLPRLGGLWPRRGTNVDRALPVAHKALHGRAMCYEGVRWWERLWGAPVMRAVLPHRPMQAASGSSSASRAAASSLRSAAISVRRARTSSAVASELVSVRSRPTKKLATAAVI
jgi:hypothetical protein